jgi:hypothetical protein
MVYDYAPGKIKASPGFGGNRNSASNLTKKHSKTIIETQIAKQQVLVLHPRIQRMTQPSQSQNKGRQQSYQVITEDNSDDEEDDASWI